MDNLRPFLYISLLFIIFLIWQAWQREHIALTHQAAISQEISKASRQLSASSGKGNPPLNKASSASSAGIGVSRKNEDKVIRIRTNVLDVVIDTSDGNILQAFLPSYPVAVNKPMEPFKLFHTGKKIYIAQSGIISTGLPKIPALDTLRKQKFTISKTYTLQPHQKVLQIKLIQRYSNGVTLRRTFIFRRDSYIVKVKFRLLNESGKPWIGSIFAQLLRSPTGKGYSIFNADTHSYLGAAWYDGSYQKASFDDISKSPMEKNVTGGWIAMVQHYFISTWIPPRHTPVEIYTKAFKTPLVTLYALV